MYGLDLFSGIGGITLALQDWVTPIAYCESDRYAQSVLLSRMSENKLPVAPIWDDITTLKGSMLPIKPDIIYGGFPCTDISVAGSGKGLGGKQSSLFFEIMRLSKELKPNFIFLENVPAIRTRGLREVGEQLAKIGYDCRWDIVSAKEMGALHRRERWFCLAYFNGKRLADAGTKQQTTRDRGNIKTTVSINNSGERVQRRIKKEIYKIEGFSWCENVRGIEDLQDRPGIPKPLLRRNSNGLLHKSHRIKCCGNAVVPIQAKEAFKRLLFKITER